MQPVNDPADQGDLKRKRAIFDLGQNMVGRVRFKGSAPAGTTTIWERWDGWTEEHGFQDPGMNSFNHYAYGSIGAWLYSTAAGVELDPTRPGYKHIILRPQPGGGLPHAAGKLKTLYGELVSRWTLTHGTFEWTVIIPPNAAATV